VNRAILAPALVALYFGLVVAAGGGSDLIRLRDLQIPVGLTLAVAAGGWALGYLVTREARRAAVISLILVAAFATFGYAHDLLRDNRIMLLGREPVLLGLYLAGTLLLVALVARSKRTFDTLLRFSTLLGALLVVFAGARVGWAIRHSGPARLALPASEIRADSQPSRPPDIYLIVPDKYTGTALLAADYGFDNHGFVEELERRGFIVPPAARANYTHTFLAFASMLNLRYLDDLPGRFGVANSSWRATYPMIEGNELAAFLKSKGYRFVFFPTAFGATRQNRFADLQLPSPNDIRSEMVTAWYRTTAIPALRRQACNVIPCTRAPPYVPEPPEMLSWKLQQLGRLSGKGKPLFALVHLTLPHEPYLFRSDCRVRTAYWPERDDGDEALAVKKAYIEQVACANRKLLSAVDSILAHSPEPPVIIIQADHGHGRLGRKLPDLAHSPEPQVAERLSVFGAYHLPGVAPEEVSDSVTPVNVLRLVLRHYFGADLPPLPDASYWSSNDRPYDFTRLR
jgi:hypothetical protein